MASLLCAPSDDKAVLASVSACHLIIFWETFVNDDCTEETQITPPCFIKDDLTSHIWTFLDIFKNQLSF